MMVKATKPMKPWAHNTLLAALGTIIVLLGMAGERLVLQPNQPPPSSAGPGLSTPSAHRSGTSGSSQQPTVQRSQTSSPGQSPGVHLISKQNPQPTPVIDPKPTAPPTRTTQPTPPASTPTAPQPTITVTTSAPPILASTDGCLINLLGIRVCVGGGQ